MTEPFHETITVSQADIRRNIREDGGGTVDNSTERNGPLWPTVIEAGFAEVYGRDARGRVNLTQAYRDLGDEQRGGSLSDGTYALTGESGRTVRIESPLAPPLIISKVASSSSAMQQVPHMNQIIERTPRMNAENPISPELQAKIDALTDDKLKKDIIFLVSGPGIRAATNEQIFNNRVASYEKAKAERAKWRKWSDEEVLAFVEYFKQEMPDDFGEFLRQEHENNEIDDEVWWRAWRLADKWMPDLDYVNYGILLGKIRDHFRVLIKNSEMSP